MEVYSRNLADTHKTWRIKKTSYQLLMMLQGYLMYKTITQAHKCNTLSRHKQIYILFQIFFRYLKPFISIHLEIEISL